jgi:ABC-type transport system involved in multi-copper enzyme maturation permease subunit
MATMMLEGWIGATLASAAYVLGTIIGAQIAGVTSELVVEQLPSLFAAGALFWGSFATFAIAASGSFDRTPPAMAITVGLIMANYIVEVLGSFWDVMEPYQFLSLFNHFSPEGILDQTADPAEALIFVTLTVLSAAWAFYKFPRRDLAAPN